jgi:hypothetical protein
MAQDLTSDQAIEQLRKLPEDQQRLVLGKLTPDALKAVRQKLEGPPIDWIANPKSEGTYKMTTNGADFIGVPYSKVLDAWKAGYKIDDEDQMRFGKDKNEETMKQRREHPMNESHFAPAPGAAAPPAPGTPLPKADFPESVSGDQGATAGFWDTARKGVSNWSQPEENAKWTNFAKRLGADLFGIADFPVAASGALIDSMSDNPNVSAPAMDQLAQMFTPEMAVQRVQEFKQEWKKNKNDAMNNAAADSLALFLAHKLGKAAGAAKSLAVGDEAARTAIRDQLDMPQRIERTVKKFGDESEKARNDLRAARQTTAQENVETIRKHNEAKEGVEEKNKATLREEKNRVDTQQKLDTASKELDEKINAAEKKANEENDAAWDVVRSKTKGVSTDISKLQTITERAADQADPATSALFKRIIKGEQPDLPTLTRTSSAVTYVDSAGNPVDRQSMSPARFDQMIESGKLKAEPVTETVNPDDPGYGDLYESQFGEPPPVGGGPAQFNRLQRWYSYISNRMYGGGRVEGGLYHAYKMVRSAINDAMQDIAKQAKATDDLDKARDLHTKKMEAFSDKPTEPGTVANYVRKKVTPEFTKDVRLEAYLTKLGAYDPSIPKLSTHIDNLSAGLKKLPDKGPVRDRLQTPPPSPTAIGGPGPEHPVAAASNIPSNPLPKEGGPVPFGEKKAVGEKPDIAKINQENIDYLNDALRRYGRVGPWVVRLLSGGFVQHLLHGETSSFSGGLMFGQAVVTLVTSILRRESALEWLARPSEEDLKVIAKLPPEDAARLREAFKAIAREEINQDPKKASIKIAPAAAVFLGTQSIQQQSLDQIKKEAEQLQSQEAPGPQSSAKPVWSHEFDPVSGNIVAV